MSAPGSMAAMPTNHSKIRATGAILAIAGLFLASCETTGLGGRGKKEDAASGVPAEGLLSAKLAALTHAMDELPAEDRRYLTEDYAAYGLMDTNPTHQQVLLKLLEGRQPAVVSADRLSSRRSAAQWFEGKPALKWTASATKDDTNPMRAEVVVGWMHSQIINRFTRYIMDYNGQSWTVVDVSLLEEAERQLQQAMPAMR